MILHYAKLCVAAGGVDTFSNRVGKAVAGAHDFDAVWAAGLEDIVDGCYRNRVTRFEAEHSPAWRVRIAGDFGGWSVEKVE